MATENGLTRKETSTPAERMERRRTVPPPVDIYENGDEVLVIADVPGASPDGITVRLDKDELFVHARCNGEGPGECVLGAPRGADYGRTFLVPRGIDADKIAADLKSGVLTIHLPKSEAMKPRKIAVRAS